MCVCVFFFLRGADIIKVNQVLVKFEIKEKSITYRFKVGWNGISEVNSRVSKTQIHPV